MFARVAHREVASIRAAYTPREPRAIALSAGLFRPSITRTFPYLVLIADKQTHTARFPCRPNKENIMNEPNRNPAGANHVCPANHAGFLASSLRKLLHNPNAILKGLVREGDTAVDIGCGPGFFTLPLARLVGPQGTVIAVDLQEAMLGMLRRRAERAGLSGSIREHRCAAEAIGLPVAADFVLAFYMAHETPDVGAFLAEVRAMLKPGGRLLLAEPRFHVTAEAFRRTLDLARAAGLRLTAEPGIALSRTAVFARD